MEKIKTIDGKTVTEEMLDRWCSALDHDEWPKGEHSIGPVLVEVPHTKAPENDAVLTLKLPASLKTAIQREAKNEGLSTSEFVRTTLSLMLVEDE